MSHSKFDFSNYFGRYEANSVHEVLVKIHQEGQTGARTSFSDWKKWNHKLWKARYNLEAPTEDTVEAETLFLEVLVKAGAIHPTPEDHDVESPNGTV